MSIVTDRRTTDRLQFVTQVRVTERQRRYLELQLALEGHNHSETIRQALDAALDRCDPRYLAQLDVSRDEFEAFLDQVDAATGEVVEVEPWDE